jgi:hypothetical protein
MTSMSSVAPGSSLCGSLTGKKGMMDDRPQYTRRTSSTSTVKSITGLEKQENPYPRIDEGYASLSGTSIGSDRSVLPSRVRSAESRISRHRPVKRSNGNLKLGGEQASSPNSELNYFRR